LRILPRFAGFFRGKLLICFVLSLRWVSHNPSVAGSSSAAATNPTNNFSLVLDILLRSHPILPVN
jgi:hypothetical protein